MGRKGVRCLFWTAGFWWIHREKWSTLKRVFSYLGLCWRSQSCFLEPLRNNTRITVSASYGSQITKIAPLYSVRYGGLIVYMVIIT